MKRRSGLTLVEVVVALALMGSVLVASMLAFAKHRRQLTLADKRIEATQSAELLINLLSNQRGGIPIRSQGLVAGKPGWIWTTRPLGGTRIATIPLRVVRFQISESAATPTVLLTLDVVKPGGP